MASSKDRTVKLDGIAFAQIRRLLDFKNIKLVVVDGDDSHRYYEVEYKGSRDGSSQFEIFFVRAEGHVAEDLPGKPFLVTLKPDLRRS